MSGSIVRHIVRLPVALPPADLEREVAEYRAVGWRVTLLWKGIIAHGKECKRSTAVAAAEQNNRSEGKKAKGFQRLESL